MINVKNVKRKRKTKMIFYIPFWLLITGAFIGLMAIQYSRYEDYRLELDRLRTELANEKQIAVDLRHRRAFYESDAYIEMLARGLRYVRQDEIVFVNIYRQAETSVRN